ncbi:MAG TPA: hypothetical protein VNR60_01755 [Croceibacterium sp.]|nr:hypothetical protein [Croceibacterium sp.]
MLNKTLISTAALALLTAPLAVHAQEAGDTTVTTEAEAQATPPSDTLESDVDALRNGTPEPTTTAEDEEEDATSDTSAEAEDEATADDTATEAEAGAEEPATTE